MRASIETLKLDHLYVVHGRRSSSYVSGTQLSQS